MKHLIITRLRYKNKELLKIRAKLMKETLIPDLISQTNQNFTLCIMVFNEDVQFLNSILQYDFISFEDYIKLKEYTIKNNINLQTRHDSDDYMADNYVEKLQNECDLLSSKHDIILLHFQPEKINYLTGEKLFLPEYTNEMISGFVSLYQKNVKITIYERSHTNLHELTKNIYKYPIGYVVYNIHGKNDSLIPRDERIKQWNYNNGIYDKTK